MIKSGLKLGFIGLGIMGAPMAGHLLKAGHTLFVNTVGPVPHDLADGGVTVCTNARGVAERADIIFIMVPDTPDVEKVLFSEYGVASGLGKGKTVVDMSSI
ncbi:MAG TPA: NAD(P)-binding domain-containing protein, partial [Ramlibacter sp.]|nr:NAD(P)-binding domain-containing protein [Ramlibacter sp.]